MYFKSFLVCGEGNENTGTENEDTSSGDEGTGTGDCDDY